MANCIISCRKIFKHCVETCGSSSQPLNNCVITLDEDHAGRARLRGEAEGDGGGEHRLVLPASFPPSDPLTPARWSSASRESAAPQLLVRGEIFRIHVDADLGSSASSASPRRGPHAASGPRKDRKSGANRVHGGPAHRESACGARVGRGRRWRSDSAVKRRDPFGWARPAVGGDAVSGVLVRGRHRQYASASREACGRGCTPRAPVMPARPMHPPGARGAIRRTPPFAAVQT